MFRLGERGARTRACAIKRLHASLADDESAVQSFIDEGFRGYDVGAHPNLVVTRDIGVTTDGRVYVVIDSAGRSVEVLAARLCGNAPALRALADAVLADAVLAALAHLHARGLVPPVLDVHAVIAVQPCATARDRDTASPDSGLAPGWPLAHETLVILMVRICRLW